MPRLLLRHTWADVAVVDLQGRSGLPARRALVTAEFVAAASIGLGVSALTVAHADGWSQVLMAVLIAGVGVNYLILATHAFRFWSRLAQGLETPRGISTAVRRETGQQSLWLIIPFVVLLPSSMSHVSRPQSPGTSHRPRTGSRPERWDL